MTCPRSPGKQGWSVNVSLESASAEEPPCTLTPTSLGIRTRALVSLCHSLAACPRAPVLTSLTLHFWKMGM